MATTVLGSTPKILAASFLVMPDPSSDAARASDFGQTGLPFGLRLGHSSLWCCAYPYTVDLGTPSETAIRVADHPLAHMLTRSRTCPVVMASSPPMSSRARGPSG